MSNNTFWAAAYDPDAPLPLHHWQMELSTICIVNSLTLITFVTRTWYRWTKMKRFRREDQWIVGATIVLIGLFVCQLGASLNGSGLRIVNVPNSMLEPHWIFSWGWIGYYLVISMTKVAICCCLLEFLPDHFKIMRRLIVGLCFFIMALAIAESLIWLIQCKPFTSNFAWNVDQTSCLDIDIPRYTWSALSIPIDIAILSVPFEVIKRTGLQTHEKRVLKLVFAANLLGTIACAAGIYGTWENRQSVQYDVFYSETAFIMINDIEILCYALGVTFPIFSRFFISKSAPLQLSPSQATRPSWLRTLSSPLAFPLTASNSALNALPRMKPNGNSHMLSHPNLLPISEVSISSIHKNRSTIYDFITVPEKINKPSTIEVGTIEQGTEVRALATMVAMNVVDNNIIAPLKISKSISTRTADLRRDSSIDRGPSPAMGDLESGIGYDAWVESGTESGQNWNEAISRSSSDHNLRTTALYGGW